MVPSLRPTFLEGKQVSPSQSDSRSAQARVLAVVFAVSVLAVVASFALLWSTPLQENTAAVYADLIIMFYSLFSAADAADRFLRIVP